MDAHLHDLHASWFIQPCEPGCLSSHSHAAQARARAGARASMGVSARTCIQSIRNDDVHRGVGGSTCSNNTPRRSTARSSTSAASPPPHRPTLHPEAGHGGNRTGAAAAAFGPAAPGCLAALLPHRRLSSRCLPRQSLQRQRAAWPSGLGRQGPTLERLRGRPHRTPLMHRPLLLIARTPLSHHGTRECALIQLSVASPVLSPYVLD